MKRQILVLLLVLVSAFAKAQLGFCNGASSEAIFTETFGTGLSSGPELDPGQTTYTYVSGSVQDGEYTVSSNLRQLSSFHATADHTGDENGKALIVNASFDPGQFYQTTITGLCENTNYEFSAWIINLLDGANNVCTGREVPVQVRFEIWDITDTNRLAQGVMEPSFATTTPTWEKYGLTFTTAAGENGCILKMVNEAPGGCGNDLAIDDIQFRTCGDVVQIIDQADNTQRIRCDTNPVETISLSAATTQSVFDSPVYQWQSSRDAINFEDIAGATGAEITATLTETTFFRVKIAEDQVNLAGTECSNFSQTFEYLVQEVTDAVVINSQVTACTGESGTLQATAGPGTAIDWYTAPIDGTLIASDTNELVVNQPGLYYAQARNRSTNCLSPNRSAVEFSILPIPLLNQEDFIICPAEMIVLDTQFTDPGATYLWNTGETTPSIVVNTPERYSCTVTTVSGCSATTSFTVTESTAPEIIEVVEINDRLKVITNDGDFMFQFNDSAIQRSNTFDISGLLQVTIKITDLQGCTTVTTIFNRLGIPEFFTPNADGFNDGWCIENISAFPSTQIEIYDRYGKPLRVLTSDNSCWYGQLNNEPLPSADYWYRVFNEEQEFRGNFSLKR